MSPADHAARGDAPAADALLALLRKDWRSSRKLGRITSRQSAFKVVFTGLFGSGIVVGLFALFLSGFQFLQSLGGLSSLITRGLFSLFFLGLGAMVLFSNIVTSYSTLFRSRETPYLLTAPLPLRTLLDYKFIESTLLSSWAFFLMIVPYVAAYAWHERLGPLFGLWTLAFSVPYLVLCCGLGTLASLAILRWFPRGRWFRLGVGLALLAALLRLAFAATPRSPDESAAFVLARIVPGLHYASAPLMPSRWVAEGIMALTRGQTLRGFLLFNVLLANALLVRAALLRLGVATFYPAYQRVAAGSRDRGRSAELLRGLARRLVLLPHDVRAIVMKDIRTFLRDPMQWSQVLVFFGLLGLHFATLRTFRMHRLPDEWRSPIVFLNIFSVSSVVCSLSSRFVFPQLSLEGHGFWILGLAPTSLGRILATKFALAATFMAGISTALMYLATQRLGVDPLLQAVALLIALAIAVGVTGLSTGLGALFLDLKQANPVAIVSGFGGTVNLVLSLGVMLACIVPAAGVFHLQATHRLGPAGFRHALVLCLAWIGALTLSAAALPLWAGWLSLKRREY
jgi:ABC-2 type transport system permease protein